jgi:hypothetical protein
MTTAALKCPTFAERFGAWRNACRLTDDVQARCLGLKLKRLRAIVRGDLPTPAEVEAIAEGMEWPADRLLALVEQERLARDLSLPAGESIRRMSTDERAWAIQEGYVRVSA